MSTYDKGKKKEDGELSNDEDQLPSKNSKKASDEGSRHSRQDKDKTNKSEREESRKLQVIRKSTAISPENLRLNGSQQLSLFGGPAIPRRAAFQQAQCLVLCLNQSRNEGQQKILRSPADLEEKQEIIDLVYVKDDDLRELEELNDGRYSGMESQESSSEEVKRKEDKKSGDLKKDNRKIEKETSQRSQKDRNDERLDKRDKNNGRDKRDRSREKEQQQQQYDRQRDNKNNYSRRERSASKKRDRSVSRRSRDRNQKDTSKRRDHSHSKRRENSQSKRRDEQSSSRRKSRSSSKRKEHSQSRRKDRSGSRKRKHSHSKRRDNRSGSKKRGSSRQRKRSSSYSRRRSPSDRRKRSDSRKDKRTQRQEDKSNKRRSNSRSNSKRKDNDRNQEGSKQQSNGSAKQKDQINKESRKKELEEQVLSEQDNALMMEMMENSDDERERKKRELLELIKGIKGDNNNTNNSGTSKQDSQNIVEKKEDLPAVPEEDGFDNDLINPDDAIDDEEDEQNDHSEQPQKKRKIEDDYQGQNDADIEAAIQLRRRRSSQDNLNYLKNLEEMRNLEIKEGLEGQEQPGLVNENENNIEQDNLPQETNIKHRDSIQKSFHDDMEEDYNSLHKLDDEKEPSDSEGDMFGDDVEKFIGDTKNKYGKVVNVECDDEQNYFKVRIGEILGSNYRIVSKCGKGVFANVVKAEQLDNGKLVAIKILRSNEIMHESGEREKEIVQKLNLSDKNDKKHIVRLKNVFEQSKHICLVFECFQMNLREALKIYGKGKGFNLDIVRSYAFQIFIALTHIKKNRLIHADLKPDNLLISEDTKTLKMCDFGTALSVEENGIIKYIQSRYYRAPEVLIGYPPYNQIDVWSIGVTLYEIYTNKYLFDGSTNNEMIKLIMDARGKFNKKMLQSGSFVEEYFDANYVFQYVQVDPLTKQKYVSAIKYGDIPKNDISKLLQTNKEGVQFENQKKLAQFKDFLDKCLQLDPKNRLTPEEALKHPFLDTTVKAK